VLSLINKQLQAVLPLVTSVIVLLFRKSEEHTALSCVIVTSCGRTRYFG